MTGIDDSVAALKHFFAKAESFSGEDIFSKIDFLIESNKKTSSELEKVKGERDVLLKESQEANQQLVELSGQLKNAQEEGQLTVLQLHQVQEKCEALFISNAQVQEKYEALFNANAQERESNQSILNH